MSATPRCAQVSLKMGQRLTDLNNWWWMDREMMRAMIDRTEQVREWFVERFVECAFHTPKTRLALHHLGAWDALCRFLCPTTSCRRGFLGLCLFIPRQPAELPNGVT